MHKFSAQVPPVQGAHIRLDGFRMCPKAWKFVDMIDGNGLVQLN